MTSLSESTATATGRPASPVDSQWPGLDRSPSGPRVRIAAAVARQLFVSAVRRLDVTVRLDGKSLGRGGPEATIHRPEEFFARIGQDQLIGFGEAYLTGAWEAEDLAGFLTVLAAEMPRLVPRPLQRLRRLVVARPPGWQRSSTHNSQDNIAHHYDLSNDLFETFLDPTLSYSSALFDAAPVNRTSTDLALAQGQKIERLLDRTNVTEGTRVLEIGSGWGELAIRAARRGARVLTITLSVEQQALARERVEQAGMSHLVEVELCDYREATGEYDAIVSIEMIEAVGHEFWPTYFRQIDRLLAPGGRVGLQAITMPDDRMKATQETYTWIHKYIFPGGFLPSIEALQQVTAEHTALRISEELSFGLHYAETLRIWDEAFLAARERVLELGFDETFIRMWHFYLAYSRAGFNAGYLDVRQLVLTR